MHICCCFLPFFLVQLVQKYIQCLFCGLAFMFVCFSCNLSSLPQVSYLLHFLLSTKSVIQINGYSGENSSLLILWANFSFTQPAGCHCLRCPGSGHEVRLCWIIHASQAWSWKRELRDIQVLFLHSCPLERCTSTESRSRKEIGHKTCVSSQRSL